MSVKYDVVIPCATKDYVKIAHCVKSLENLDPHPQNIHIVAKDRLKVKSEIAYTLWEQEEEAISIEAEEITYRRPKWIYQQILKMTQDFTENDWYLCVVSDLVINKKLKLFTDDRPNYFISSHKQNHRPYFDFMEKVWGLKKQVKFSFISDITMFNKKILREIVPSSRWLLEKCNQYLSDDCLIGEPEIYGNWLDKHYPASYNTVDVKVSMYGKFVPDLYRSEEIEEILAKEKNTDNDIIAMHSWT